MPRNSSTRLDRKAWVNAAIKALCSRGLEAVSVETLAKQLNISKGSFYWHFKNRDDLLEAILDEWEVRQANWSTESDGLLSPVERWTRLFDIVAEPGYAHFELAMSSWARLDEKVARRIANAERKRVVYLSRVFREIGFTPAQSEEWATAAMFLYLGWMERSTRDKGQQESRPALADVLSRFVLAASALASQEALRQSR